MSAVTGAGCEDFEKALGEAAQARATEAFGLFSLVTFKGPLGP